jgi:hypothetical protein
MRPGQYVQALIYSLERCCNIIESIEKEQSQNDSSKRKSWTKRLSSGGNIAEGSFSTATAAVCDYLVDAANGLGRALEMRFDTEDGKDGRFQGVSSCCLNYSHVVGGLNTD